MTPTRQITVRAIEPDAPGVPAASDADLKAFLALPDLVYAGDPRYNPTPRGEVLAGLRRPEFSERQRVLLAMDGDRPLARPLARAIARRSPSLRDDAGLPYGMIGFFEAVDGPAGEEAAAALLAEGVRWLRETGAGAVVGPMDGDTWHRYRLNAGPASEPPFLLEPYNPPYCPALWQAAGFRVLETYASTWADTATVVRRLEPRRREALIAGYRLRPFAALRFEDELAAIYELSTQVFAGNFLYTAISEDDFIDLYSGSRSLIDPGLIWFAEAPQGEDVGFLFAYPDLFQAVAAMRGRRDLAAKIRFLWSRQGAGMPTAVNVKTLGVLPEHRRSGVGAALMHRVHVEALERGLKRANYCLFRVGNPSGDMAGKEAKPLRTYHLYQYEG